MQKSFKRIISAVLTIVMIFSAISFLNMNYNAVLVSRAEAKDLSSYKVGDTITFGSYPQSRVTNGLILNGIKKAESKYSWISYNYYSGSGIRTDGNMKPDESMMYYKDITYNNNVYRAVKINHYRPYYTGIQGNADETFQDDNGYYTGNVYYFKYEPLTWRILDPSEGFVLCTTALDSQAYNNYFTRKNDESFGDSSKSHYASDWSNSSMRCWLNNDFCNTAFSAEERAQIGTTQNENNSLFSARYNSADTSDKIFLLSYNEVINGNYGFSTSASANDTARQIKPTDYAQCQGCYKETKINSNGNAWWHLRSPQLSAYAASVNYNGCADDDEGYSVTCTSYGVVPAFKFNPKAENLFSAPIVTASNVASSGKVKLTWNAVPGAVSYKVYRATSKNGSYRLMKTTTSTSYINTSGVAGTTYYYKVKAVAPAGKISKTSVVKIRTCDLAKPTNVKKTTTSKGYPKVTWNAVDGAESYKVYRATNKDGTYKLMKTTTSLSYINTSAVKGKTYYYKVKAVCSNSAANSAYSSIVSIKAK